MINRYTHGGLVWIDLESPTHDEVRRVMNEYAIHPLVAEELLLPSAKPRVDVYDNFIYLILHFPAFRHSHKKESIQEIDFIISDSYVITTRYDTVDPLHKFSKILEVNAILDKSTIGEHGGFLFYFMLRELYNSLQNELEYIHDSLKEIEVKVFAGEERAMVLAISHVSRKLLSFKHATTLHREILSSFETAGKDFFGKDFAHYLQGTVGEYYKVESVIESNMELLMELRETNNSLLTTQQSEVIKTLTVITFIGLPLSIIVAFFEMSESSRAPAGILMVLAAVCFFLFSKAKHWM